MTKLWPEVIGHDRIKQVLAGILAQGRVPQAQLWAGPAGLGKLKLARLFAQVLVCTAGPAQSRPCQKCPNCLKAQHNSLPDLIELKTDQELAKAGLPPFRPEPPPSPKFLIDQVRFLADQVAFGPRQAPYLVCLIPEADRFTEEAADCFLKLLEEPPAKVIFVLTTAQPDALPATIVSRCQVFNFSPLLPEQAVEVLKRNGWPADLAAAAAQASLGDLSLLPQDPKEFQAPSLESLFPKGLGQAPEKIFSLAGELSAKTGAREDNLDRLAWLILATRQRLVRDLPLDRSTRAVGQLEILLQAYQDLQQPVNQRLFWEATFLKLSRLER